MTLYLFRSLLVLITLCHINNAHAQEEQTPAPPKLKEMDENDLILFNVAAKGRVVELLANELARTEIIRALLVEYATECVANVTALERQCLSCMLERCQNRMSECDIKSPPLSEVISHNPSPIKGLQFLSQTPREVDASMKEFANKARTDILKDVPESMRQESEAIMHSEVDQSLKDLSDNLDAEQAIKSLSVHVQKAADNMHRVPDYSERIGTIIIAHEGNALNLAEILASSLRSSRPFLESMDHNTGRVMDQMPTVIEEVGQRVQDFKNRIAGVFNKVVGTFNAVLSDPETDVENGDLMGADMDMGMMGDTGLQQMNPNFMMQQQHMQMGRNMQMHPDMQTLQAMQMNPNFRMNGMNGLNPNMQNFRGVNQFPVPVNPPVAGAVNMGVPVARQAMQMRPMAQPQAQPFQQGRPNGPPFRLQNLKGNQVFEGRTMVNANRPQNGQQQPPISRNERPPQQPIPSNHIVPQHQHQHPQQRPQAHAANGIAQQPNPSRQASQTQNNLPNTIPDASAHGHLHAHNTPNGVQIVHDHGHVHPNHILQNGHHPEQGIPNHGPISSLHLAGHAMEDHHPVQPTTQTHSGMQHAQGQQFQNRAAIQGRRKRHADPDCQKLKENPDKQCRAYESHCHNCTLEKRLRFEVCGDGVEKARDEIKRIDLSVISYLKAYDEHIVGGPLVLKIEFDDNKRLHKTNSYYEAFVTAKIGPSIHRYKTKMILNSGDVRTSGSQIGDEIWEKLWKKEVFAEAKKPIIVSKETRNMGQNSNTDVHHTHAHPKSHLKSGGNRVLSSWTSVFIGACISTLILVL